MELFLAGEISPASWSRPRLLARRDDAISCYLLKLEKHAVGFVLLVPPPGTFFAEFGLFRPFQIAHRSWLAGEEYDEGEEEMKHVFAPICPDRALWPQVGDQTHDRIHIAIPMRAESEVIAYLRSAVSQFDAAVSPGRPWTGVNAAEAPDARWIMALTEWPEAAETQRDERIRLCRTLVHEAHALPEPKSMFPLAMARKVSVSLALLPHPRRGEFSPRLDDFDDLHIARAELVAALKSPCLFNAIHAAANTAVDASGVRGSREAFPQWKQQLNSYFEEMEARYPVLAQDVSAFFV